MFMPLVYCCWLYMFAFFDSAALRLDINTYAFLLVLPLTIFLRELIDFCRKLPGFLYARRVYANIDIKDHLLKCTKWPNIASSLMDKGILKYEFEFGSLQASLDCVMIDIFNRNLANKKLSSASLACLKKCIHRSIRGNYDLKYSLLIQFIGEVIFWPYLVTSRLLALFIEICPWVYTNPGWLLQRTFRPSMTYRHRGYYEFEFDTEKKLDEYTSLAQEFINEFPSPTIEAISHILGNIAGLILVYFLYARDVSIITIVISILYSLNSLRGRLSGGYNPYRQYPKLSDKFDLDPDNPVIGLEFFMTEMPRRIFLVIVNIISIILMPFVCLHFFGTATDIQVLIGKKIVTMSGEPGLVFSTRVYRHTAFDGSTEMIDAFIDPWLEKSIIDFKREYADTIARGSDV